MYEELRAGLLDAVADGTISEERLNGSVERIVAAKYAANVGPASGEGLPEVKGAGHLRVLAALFDAIADGRERDGHP